MQKNVPGLLSSPESVKICGSLASCVFLLFFALAGSAGGQQQSVLPTTTPRGVTPSTAHQIAPPHAPPMQFKSPVMQRLFEGHNHHSPVFVQSSSVELPSPFLTTPPMYAAGSSLFDLALGDFNSDGKQDVIVAADPPVLLTGNGDGTLQPPFQIGTIPTAPTGVAVGDFNHDGRLDVVFAISGGAVVYLGNGDGTFGEGSTFSSGGTNQNVFARVLVADANNDGIADLILNNDRGISVLLGNGNGTFQAFKNSVGSVQSMSAADFNGDGRVDLAVSNGFDGLSIMLGNGNGTFAPGANYSATEQNLNAIAIADYNQDGLMDVALPNGQLFLGNGDGTLRPPTAFPTSPDASVVATADVNGDGIPDLLTVTGDFFCGQSDFGTTGVSLGNGDGTFQPVTVFDSGGCSYPTFMALGDLNSDGVPDVVVLSVKNSTVPELSVLINKGDGKFPVARLNISGGSGGAAVADFNHDGDADLVLADGSVYLGNGDGSLRFSAAASLGGVAVATGDFDRDGNPDLAAAVECAPSGCSSGGQLLIVAGNSDGTFQPPIQVPSGGFYAESLVVADFNGDGILDIAVANNCMNSACSGGGSITVYLGNGNGTFNVFNTTSTISGNPSSIAAGDFNNDGVTDLLVGMAGSFGQTGVVNTLLGNGDGSFQSPIVVNTPDQIGISAVAIGDFNDDGILDLAVAEGTACSDCGAHGTMMYGNGDGTFANGPEIGTEGGPPHSVVAADFYGTGTPTPVLANYCGDSLDCPAGSVMIPGTQNQTDMMLQFLAVGDFNNDGKPDLAGSLQYDAGASVLLNIGATAEATKTTLSPSAPQSYLGSQPVTFTAQIKHTGPGTPTGTMEFIDSGAVIASVSVDSNGQASLTSSSLAVGPNFVIAQYQGDGSFAPSNSLGVRVIVNGTNTSTNLVSSQSPSTFGQSVNLTASVSAASGTPAGSVVFTDGFISLGTSPLAGGIATLTTSSLGAGAHSITASYSGNADFSPSASAALAQTVNQATSTVSLNCSSCGDGFANAPITFVATITPQLGGTATGTVTFSSLLRPSRPAVLGSAAVGANTAALTASLPVGMDQVTATYAGDANVAGSTSSALGFTIHKAVITIALTASAVTVPGGQPVTFTATLSTPVGPPPDGTQVSFNSTQGGSGVGYLSGGVASFTTSSLSVGPHAFKAVYPASAVFAASSSPQVIVTVEKTATTSSLTSGGSPSVFGESVTFSAAVTSSSGGVPTGTVKFRNGSSALGTGTLIGGAATFSTSALSVGTHSITADYSGDATHAPSSSAPLLQVVTRGASTTSLASSQNPSSAENLSRFPRP